MDTLCARDLEQQLVDRCAEAAADVFAVASDVREANVFRLAAMIVGPRYQAQAKRLLHASEQYFAQHSDKPLEAAEVLRKTWIVSLPRLREMLTRKFDERQCAG